MDQRDGTKNKYDFCEALKVTTGVYATLASLEPKATLEVRDLDSLTTLKKWKKLIGEKSSFLLER